MAGYQLTPYDSLNVTVPNDGANHSLFDLMKALNPSISSRTKYFVIQNSPGHSNDTCLMGEGPIDSQGNANANVLSSTMYGCELVKGASETFGGWHDQDFNIVRFYVRTAGVGTVQLNIQILRG